MATPSMDLFRSLGTCIQCGEPSSTAYCEACLPSRTRSEDSEREIETREGFYRLARMDNRRTGCSENPDVPDGTTTFPPPRGS